MEYNGAKIDPITKTVPPSEILEAFSRHGLFVRMEMFEEMAKVMTQDIGMETASRVRDLETIRAFQEKMNLK